MRIPCTHQAPESCRECDGAYAEEAEYWTAMSEQRQQHNRALTRWWLCTGPRARNHGTYPAPREDLA
jgi:hypothetical protein